MVIAVIVVAFLLAGVALFIVRRGRSAATAATADGLGSKVKGLFSGGATDDAWARLEDLLIRADVGPKGAADLLARVKRRVSSGAEARQALREEVEAVLGGETGLNVKDGELTVVMVVGVNGSGKTTTIGKLAKRLGDSGLSVMLAGSDTFRAAAGEQLDVWADRSRAQVVRQARGADPASVAFDGVKSAQARGSDVLIVDTAGRLHTRTPLMDELDKVKRVLAKAAGRDPQEVLLVLDASTGQNGISQARAFTEAVGVTGVALTKLDGTAKGGIVLAVKEELGVPVKLVGTGEGPADLELFDAKAFAERMIG